MLSLPAKAQTQGQAAVSAPWTPTFANLASNLAQGRAVLNIRRSYRTGKRAASGREPIYLIALCFQNS